MRLIPPNSNIFSRDGKVKIASLLARQDALNSRLAHATTTEFASNLLLDKPSPHSFKSLRQVLMEIKSTLPNSSVFHTIDRLWGSDRAVCFTYVPENSSDGHKYVAGLIPYLRLIDPWFLSQFTEDARNLHRNNHWNPGTQEVASTEELEMVNNVYGDDELNCSDKPTAIRDSAKATIEIVMPDVDMEAAPHVMQDDDSISTFRSKASKIQSALKPSSHTGYQSSNVTNTTYATTVDDGSVSKLSDNTSRLLAFEDHFNKVTQVLQQKSDAQEQSQLENKLMLSAIMDALNLCPVSTAGQPTPATASGQPSTPSIQANSLSQSYASGGSIPRTAGYSS